MPSSISHPLVAVAIGSAVAPRSLLRPFPQFFSPFSTRGYTSPWQPIDGPFSELFFCIVPLLVLTRVICQYRGIAWPRWRDTGVIELQVGRGADERE